MCETAAVLELFQTDSNFAAHSNIHLALHDAVRVCVNNAAANRATGACRRLQQWLHSRFNACAWQHAASTMRL